MSEIPKEIIEFTGIEAASLDEFKTKFQETFVTKENAAKDKDVREKVAGAVLNSEMTNLRKIARDDLGMDLETEDVRNIKKNEDFVAHMVKTLQGKHLNETESLRKTASSGNDEKVKEITEKYQKLETKLKETDSAWKQLAQEKELLEKDFSSKLKSKDIDFHLTKIKEGVKTKPLTDVEKIGFNTALKDKFRFDLDDKGNLEVFDTEGKPIKSKQKAGEFLKPQEALQELVDELKLSEVNPHGGKPAPASWQNPKPRTTNVVTPAPQQPTRGARPRVHPDAQR